jgi:hypothetical protein
MTPRFVHGCEARRAAAKREPSPEGLGLNSEDNLSAVGAALYLGPLSCVIRTEIRISYYAALTNGHAFSKESRMRSFDTTKLHSPWFPILSFYSAVLAKTGFSARLSFFV